MPPKKKQNKGIADKPEIIVENDSDAKSGSLDSDSDRSVKRKDPNNKDPNYVDFKRGSFRRNGKTQALSPRGFSPDIVA